MTSDELLEKIRDWARSNDNITAVIMTGSRSRNDNMLDEFSDLDLELIAENRELLSLDDSWFRLFADVWTTLALDEGQENPTRLVIYDGGHKVDFTLADRRRVADMVASKKLNGLYERGYQVLIDKEGIARGLPQPTGAFPVVALPDQEEFRLVVEEFWFEASHIPRYLLRNELWVVKFRDWTMKSLLLRMLEWHTVATSNNPVDIWYIGSHMQDWMDDQTWSDVQDVFSRFDAEDSWWGLLATMSLFSRLGQEIAASCELEYPRAVDENISDYVMGFADRLQHHPVRDTKHR